MGFIPTGAVGQGGAEFGTGQDGAAVFDGSSTVLGLVPSAGVYSLTTDLMLYSCTINPGVQVQTLGWRFNVAATLANNGILSFNGNPGTNTGTPGAGVASGSITLNGSSAGGAGSTTAGSLGTASLRTIGGSGGAGGAGSGGAGAAAGTVTPPTSAQGGTKLSFSQFMNAQIWIGGTLLGEGSGGGGGGGDTVNSGGGGGASGGALQVLARYISGVGQIQAIGGRGGDGSPSSAAGAGGGGGGGGGFVIVVSSSVLLTASGASIPGQAVSAAGGAGGAGHGTSGVNGGPGLAGNVYLVPA